MLDDQAVSATTPSDDRRHLRQASVPQLIAELRHTELQVGEVGLLSDNEAFTPLMRLALRELHILRELRRRKLLVAANR